MAATTTTNIGINGFGRVGRQAFRASLGSSDLRVVAINDPFLDVESVANAIRLDSNAGRFRGTVEIKGKNLLVVDGARVAFTSVTDPAQIPWTEQNVAYVLECSGVYTTAERAASHLAGGAQRVIIGTVSADAPPIVLGANEESFKPSTQVLSAASDITVALAPVLRVLHNTFGVTQCTYTCLHAASGARAVDSSNIKDPRGSRGALGNVVPITNAPDVKALQRVLPRLAGRVTGTTIRVPVAVGSMLDVVVILNTATSLTALAEAL
jgi:glyceraldehyde 3-phosphate dehydrogenase